MKHYAPHAHARRKPPQESKPPTADDVFCDHLREVCARAMAKHLKDARLLDRQVKTLNLAEMLQLAEACTAAWICEVAKRIAENRNAVPERYVNVLMV